MTIGLKIKDVAEATGFTTATLRYYEQIGLLPQASRTPSGYRVYDQGTLDRLAFIARAKQLGCTLEEITALAEVWDGGRCGPVQDGLRRLVAAKIASAQHQIADLMTFTAELQHAAEVLGRHRPAGPCDDGCGCVGDPGPASTGRSTMQTVALTTKPTPLDEPAIVCTLAPSGVHERVDAWQALLHHVTRREPIDGGVRCVFAGTVPLDHLVRLAADEQSCCGFFSFTITLDHGGTALEVRAPIEAQPMVRTMFGTAR